MTQKRILAGLLVLLLIFGLTACGKPAEPTPNTPADPGTQTDPGTNTGSDPGNDKPIQTGPGEPVKDPGTLKGEKEGDIPVALRMVRELRSHSKPVYYGEYGAGMIESRAMTACETVYPADDYTFRELAATLGEHFDKRDEPLADMVDELYDYALGFSPDEALWTVPIGFAAVDGVYLRFETTLHRADTRVVSFTEELYTNSDADARSFVTTNVDTQTGAILSLDDVLDHLPEAHALIESKIKETYGDFDPPEEYAFTVDWQGITLYFDYPELDFLAEAPTIWLGFAEYPDYIKSYYREVPDAFAVSYKAIEEHGFDRDGDGTMEGLIPAGEWGENWLLCKNGKTYLANFTNSYNPWERLMDSEADWECHLYAIDESGPDFLWIYPGKPFGNELTDPDDFSLQTRVELLDSSEREEGNPYTPVTVHVCLNDE
ncbi:MAG: hypothetical protein IKX91_04060 [Firmicutes bacterium]|nr:hypothetical protein [Bacillota bacterium]